MTSFKKRSASTQLEIVHVYTSIQTTSHDLLQFAANVLSGCPHSKVMISTEKRVCFEAMKAKPVFHLNHLLMFFMLIGYNQSIPERMPCDSVHHYSYMSFHNSPE